MTEFNPTAYAHQFTTFDADEYAREAYDRGDLADPDKWAHETADGLEAVIYTWQALALYATGMLDNEDDDAIKPQDTSSAVGIIDGLVTGLSYEWHRRILADAALRVLEEVSA